MKKQSTTNNIKVPNKNSAILKKNFPHCFDKDGNFDFDKFKQELSKNDYIDFSNESYEMDWLGKSYARLIASDEATTLLKEDKEWNKKEENKNSENLLIKGDNLEVLKHLSNAYYEGIKMIYIDPPYNTGSDGFVYEDDRKFTVEELSKLAGIDEEKAKRILDFTQSKSNSHSAWLTFMYPRLYIAKQLLKEDGVIFISIDDNEVAQLRLMMDEIFGEENFVSEIIWYSKYTVSNDTNYLSQQHEYILLYAKQKEKINKKLRLKRTKEMNARYRNPDNDPRGPWKATPLHAKSGSGESYQFKFSNGIIWSAPSGRYPRFSQITLSKMEQENRISFGRNGISTPSVKTFLKELGDDRVSGDLWKYNEVGHTHSSNEELAHLIGKGIFDNPKPTKLIKKSLELTTNSDDIVLDFFAGSGTTGDAVMQLNAKDDGNRKYILVQLPEQIDEKKNKTAYDFVKNELKIENPTIFEITKERLIRSAKKIQEDNKKAKEVKDLSNIDFGFKVFETTPIWEDYNIEAENFDSQMELFDESKLTKEDLETLLTTWKTYDGFSLTQDLNKIDIDGYTAYYLDNKLYLMDKGFETKNLKKLLEEIDANKGFNPASIIVFGYNFQSKILREIADNVKNYANKKQIEIDLITRY